MSQIRVKQVSIANHSCKTIIDIRVLMKISIYYSRCVHRIIKFKNSSKLIY